LNTGFVATKATIDFMRVAAGAGDFASSGPGPVSMPRSQRPPAAAPAENVSQEISDDDVPF